MPALWMKIGFVSLLFTAIYLLPLIPYALSITCYECTSSQGEECKNQATSCQYGFFGCVKIAAYSGGVDRMGMWAPDQDRRIITMIRGCAILPIGGADMCEQTSILGARIQKCTCFNDFCNTALQILGIGLIVVCTLGAYIAIEML